ncbi:MAG: murein L,D-transpeptidase, partial [Hyphomicrobiales bacterium]|nr:murein L,D-transpeptidase [Hyphomicrobiales bacterium]
MSKAKSAVKSAKSLLLAAALAAGGLALAGCEGATDYANRAYAPIPGDTEALMRAKDMTDASPIMIRTYKKEATLEIWKADSTGRFRYLKTFPICRWSGQLGPKTREGDRQVPEGFYSIAPAQMNPNSHYYLSFNVGYPNAYDREHGRTGGSIMVHGVCSSAGCFSMTDKQIGEIYALAREAFAGGQREIQMQALPFRMTAKNLAAMREDRNIAFWRELKVGVDHFDVTRRPPVVAVCGGHYHFGVTGAGGRAPMGGPCPALTGDPRVEAAVASKEQADDAKVAALVQGGLQPVRVVYADGGQNAAFATDGEPMSRPDAI